MCAIMNNGRTEMLEQQANRARATSIPARIGLKLFTTVQNNIGGEPQAGCVHDSNANVTIIPRRQQRKHIYVLMYQVCHK